MWGALFTSALLAAADPAAAPSPAPLDPPPAASTTATNRLLAKLAQVPPGPERTLRASELLIGSPYEKHPLGEGAGIDKNPRLRLDAFDCQTYVETALALGQAQTDAELRATLDDIRYASHPSFAERNHFMMSQWVPNNLEKGYFTRPEDTGEVAQKVITAESWATRAWQSIELPASRIPLGTFSLPLTTLDRLEATAASIPSGTVMLVVREDRPHIPDRVTHLGFVIQKNGATFFRHASDDPYQRVVDEPLAHFIARNRKYEYAVSGVALLPLRNNRARVVELRTVAGQAP